MLVAWMERGELLIDNKRCTFLHVSLFFLCLPDLKEKGEKTRLSWK
jgi:hypothetical protein